MRRRKAPRLDQSASFDCIRVRARPCPICGDANHATPAGRYSRAPWDIIHCAGCGFAHIRTVPEAAELSKNLAWEKTYATEQQRRKRETPVQAWMDTHMRWRLHLMPRVEPVHLVNHAASPGPVLDLGCGSGAHLLLLKPGLVPHGIEISEVLAGEARDNLRGRGGQIVHASAHEGLARFDDDFFSAAILRSYLEHDANAREVMLLLGRKLRPGGIVVIKVPNYGSINRRVMGKGWCGFRLPDHVNYFSRASLRQLGQAAGLHTHFPLHLALPTDDNIVAIMTRPGTSTLN